jgi:hypothetical protein
MFGRCEHRTGRQSNDRAQSGNGKMLLYDNSLGSGHAHNEGRSIPDWRPSLKGMPMLRRSIYGQNPKSLRAIAAISSFLR